MHASKNEKEEKENHKFFEKLASTIDEIPRYGIKIIIVNMIAQIGREEIFRETTGGYSKHDKSNENGITLIEFATEMGIIMQSAAFQRESV